MSGDFCKDFYLAHWSAIELYFVPSVAGLQCILLSFVIYRSWKQIMRATRDEETGLMTHEDNTSLIFPVYIRMLCLCAIAEFADGVMTIVVGRTGFNSFPESGNVLEMSIVVGASYMIYRSAIESMVVMFLMQGMGAKTLKLAACAALSSCLLMWSGKTLYYFSANKLIQLLVDGSYCLVYCSVFTSTFFGVGRPALRRFALFFGFYHSLVFIGDLCHFFDRGCSTAFCLEPATNILFIMVFPWICFTALRADSKFWQGLADDPSFAVTSQSTDVQGPLSGICLAPETASMVAATVDNLNAVPLLNFALLRIDRSKTVKHQQLETSQVVVLGAGGNSRVFQGKYDGRPVAIKMLFSPQLTPAVVATFCREAATLGTLKHPHVVEILGICISPPSVSLVMELCDGTLFDLLHSSDKPIDWELQLRLAYECALAVEYLHSQSPPVLHLDIKSPNFLLSKYGKVKIADLELSRRGRESELGKAALPDTLNWTAPEALQVKGGKTIIYDEKTDVYSLGCVLWEIIHRKVPYQSFLDDIRKTHLDSPRARRSWKGESEPVRLSDYKNDPRSNLGDRSPLLRGQRRLISNAHAEEILANCIVEQQYRPPIDEGTHPDMARIIAEAWQTNPQARPSASQIVRALDRMRLTLKEDVERFSRR